MGRDRLAARRRELGLSQEQLAYALGHDPTTIGRWERAETTPQPLHRAPLAKALDVTLPELNAMLRDVADPPQIEPDAGRSDLALLRATTRQIIELDTRHGGDDLVPLAVRSFRASQARLVRGDDGHDDDGSLASAVAEAGQVAAWIAYDADDQALSRQLHHEALVIARLAGDRPIELFLLASLAMQAAYVGDGVEALRIADDVLDDGHLTPRMEALFLVRRARGLALADDRRRALDTLARARSLLADGATTRDPPWTWWFTEAELSWHEGMVLARIDSWPAAVDSFHAATELRGRHLRRSHYNDTVHLWTALLAAGAWRDAEPLAVDLATRHDDLRSGRTRALLRRAIAHAPSAPYLPSTLSDATDALRRFVTPTPSRSQ